ncbi:uncharacterized protein [Haliotis cracherodii]|uniref:uncharacterized protein LOC124122541 n=1 Tax=Haliotis rufescens TaxID=6454 RepID=UPI001EAF9656|nr:uncharacterized protein LOC124122541 [Haliotis rufescens]
MVRQSNSVHVVCFVSLMLLVLLQGLSSAAPIDDFTDDDEEAIKRSMMLSRLMAVTNRLNFNRPLLGGAGLPDLAPPAPFANNEEKRFRAPLQGRSGGMSLCLWKVCPAAPWLVSKKSVGK